MSYKGRFSPKNPSKYRGDPTKIIFRSLWEYKCMKHFDQEQNVLEWSSEEVIIPYLSPIDNKMHRYFVDFYVKIRTKDGLVREILVEVKPENQTKPPALILTEKKQKPTRRYLLEYQTWLVNEAKWKSAIEYCKDRGYEFKIFTEKNCGFF